MFRKKKVMLSEVFATVKPRLHDNHYSKLHTYIVTKGYWKVFPEIEDCSLDIGDVLEFIEYWWDEDNVVHRNGFQYKVE